MIRGRSQQSDKPTDKAQSVAAVNHDIAIISDDDIYLFNRGSHYRLYEKMGAHVLTYKNIPGTHFALWAPNASKVSVLGDFNGWNRESHPLQIRGKSGIWEGFIPGVEAGALYKYHIISRYHNYRVDKADPFAFFSEIPPKTASVVSGLDYQWQDLEWMQKRRKRNSLDAPISVYEMHPGSWQRVYEDNDRYLSYRELAPRLVKYVHQMNFTHVEFLPIMEHPFYGSWGYQTTGYFAPTSRYGNPQDLMYLIDYLHQHDIGVILDWVPSHFPNDDFALSFFDGTHLFEHKDPRQGIHPDWNSNIFNYGRDEIRSFLTSSAIFWLDKYHADGLRVDAVASMLYLDYGRKEGKWVHNKYGGRENLEAIAFLKQLNEVVYKEYPEVQTIAEESTAWPMVSRPTYLGGLGFGMKWDMGWMHDTLSYMTKDPIYRKYHQNNLTFRMMYAFYENFIMPLSHDEVVYGKGSLLGKMPGDDWQKFANLRLLLGYMYAQSGKKLLFMGGEFGQQREWTHEESLEWHLLQYHPHTGLQQWVADLNLFYRNQPALYQLDFEGAGFEWIDCNDIEHSVVSLIRKGRAKDDLVVIVCNFTPEPLFKYRIGVPTSGTWQEVLNSDATKYYGSGHGNHRAIRSSKKSMHGRPYSINLTLPPLSVIFLKQKAIAEQSGRY